jgi:predicted enzyme related to lactoylglutathione lyase
MRCAPRSRTAPHSVPKIVNFHLPADDVERAATFYRAVFGWEFVRDGSSAVPYLVHAGEDGGAGIPAAITAREAIVKAPVPTIEVEHIDQAMLDIALRGGQQGRVSDIAGIGRFGYAIDSEGNVIALLQRA